VTENDVGLLKLAIQWARDARAAGNHPFGAVLADAHGRKLIEAGNTVTVDSDCTAHAETNLVRLASKKYDSEFLRSCTLYSSTEPCAMCAGAIYWSGIGRVVYALSEEGLKELTGSDPENPTLDLPCREVFARGQRKIGVEGPFEVEGATDVHEGFWNR
jgi:tRNA(Arg) A34 adenosine deaminase TadA